MFPFTRRRINQAYLVIPLLVLSACENVNEILPELDNTPPKVNPIWQTSQSASNSRRDNTPAFDPVYIKASSGVEGNGARFRLRDRCVTITAGHVVDTALTAVITPTESAVGQAVVGRPDQNLDVALVKQRHESTEDCPVFPAANDIANSILGAKQREVWYREPGGGIATLNVDLVRATSDNLELARESGPKSVRFQPGMSGAVVVFDGVPVAILRNVETVDDGVANATRLDAVALRFRDQLPQPITSSTDATPAKPFDLEQLPKFYRDIVLSARRTKSRVVRVMALADETRIKAEDAAAIARQLPRSFARNGYAHFKTSLGDYYAGEVDSVGNLLSANGFGRFDSNGRDSFGNKFYCRHVRNKGCNGVGILEFAENAGNSNSLDIWKGGFVDGKRQGLGYVRWKVVKEQPRQAEAWYHRDSKRFRPGVWQSGDGTTFEGEISTRNWHGWGVLWSADGQVLALGRWENGKTVEIQTEAWRAGALE